MTGLSQVNGMYLCVLKDKVVGTTRKEAQRLNPSCIMRQPCLPQSLRNCLSGIPRERGRSRDKRVARGKQR